MKQSRVWTVFYCTSVIFMSILLHGCAGTRHTPTTQSVPIVTTETHTIVEQRVKSPETSAYEMKVVSEERARTVSTQTGETVFDPPRSPNAHTKHGHSAGNTGWYFYTLSLFLAAFYLLNH